MRTVQNMLKECDIKECLLLLLTGVPKKRFSKMLQQYYSFYCAAVETWYGEGTTDWILTDFTQSEFKDGRAVYCFYGKKPEMSGKMDDKKIDWDQVILGKIRVYIPDCIDEKINDVVLCSMFLYHMYEQCTITVQKNSNKKLFEYIKALPRERTPNISACESLLELTIHYLMDRHYINNAILEYKESMCPSLKWGDLLCDFEVGLLNCIMDSQTGAKFLTQALKSSNLPDVYHCFYHLDDENPPDLRRLYIRLKCLWSDYEAIELSDYLKVTNQGKRIIVENNVCCKKFPLIYVRDSKGNKIEIKKVSLSELLCMNIYLLDLRIVKPEQVLALLAFYLEYPIRVERIQRKCFMQSVIGMKIMSLIDTAVDL